MAFICVLVFPSKKILQEIFLSVKIQHGHLKSGEPFVLKIPTSRFQSFKMQEIELSKISNDQYFGVVPLYNKNPLSIFGHSKISKNIFSHPKIFLHQNYLESKSRPLNNPVSLRIPSSYFNKIKSLQTTEIENQKNLIKSTLLKSYESTFCIEPETPLNTKVVSKFASYRKLPTGVEYFHTGLDLRAAQGTSIFAMADGQVKLSQFFYVPGNAVIIDHGNYIFSKYYHLSEVKVFAGQYVRKGDVIGLSGATGRVEAPHLHWELTWKGLQMDPIAFLNINSEICASEIGKTAQFSF